VKLAADVAMAGMDPMCFLESDDPVEAMVMLGIARRWFRRREELDQALAERIIATLGTAI
jgi:hypothetical protein